MDKFQKLIEENPTMLIYLVGGVAALFIVGFVAGKIVSTQKRKRLREESGMAEILFDATVRFAGRMITDAQFAGYKVYSVNGAEPRIVGKGLVVAPGACTIEVEYVNTDYASRKRSLTTLHGKRTVQLQAESGGQYRVVFDQNDGEFKVR